MRRLAALVVISGLHGGCKAPMAKIHGLREALERDDASVIGSATSGYAKCADTTPYATAPNHTRSR